MTTGSQGTPDRPGTSPAGAPGTSDRPATAPAGAPGTGSHHARALWGEGAAIVCDNLVRIFKVADLEVVALQGLDLLVDPGELVAIVGASGSGKSTLLSILGGLDVPSAGRAIVANHDLGQLSRAERTRYRREIVGIVWQQTAQNLLPYLSAAENVELPMVLEGRRDRRARAGELLDLVGLAGRADHRPERLSGGEQQRVAIAVALANHPSVVLADEPTGELDSATSAEIFALLRRVNAELGTTIVVVTHDATISEQVSRTVRIRDGRTSTETVRRTEVAHDGAHRAVSEEFAVLDRAGRLQLPAAHIEALELSRRVRLRLEEDRVEIRPDRRRDGAGGPADAGAGPGGGGGPTGAPGAQSVGENGGDGA